MFQNSRAHSLQAFVAMCFLIATNTHDPIIFRRIEKCNKKSHMTPKIAISFHLYCKQDCIPSKIARGSEISTRKVHMCIEILYGGKIDRKDKRISDMSDSPKYYKELYFASQLEHWLPY